MSERPFADTEPVLVADLLHP
ncbi:MAG: hypothetical protein K0S65_6582, partial [Labilithrix sp.]|nr:hypothetical protein [Labilithrix sp.]